MKPLITLLAVGVMIAGPVHGQSQFEKNQLEKAEYLNDKCRSGSGDDPVTMGYCKQRDAAFAEITAAGWCYGDDQKWRRCSKRPVPAAKADEAYVYPFAGMRVGETVNNPFPTILYTQKPCALPLAHAKDMRAYASYRGVWDEGCWGTTIDGNALVVVPHAPTKTFSLSVLPRADVQADRMTMTIKALPTYGR